MEKREFSLKKLVFNKIDFVFSVPNNSKSNKLVYGYS